MFDEERRGDHPHAVVHPSRRPKLAHTRVHDWIARASGLPSFQVRRNRWISNVAPEQCVHRFARIFGAVIGILADYILAIFAPNDLFEEYLD